MSSGGALGVAFVEIVCAELVIGTTIAHDVVRDFENVVTDRNDRLFVAALAFDATVPSLERGCASPILRRAKIVDAGAMAGDSMRDASRRSDDRGNSIRLIDASRPAARDTCLAPPVGRPSAFESALSTV